MTWIIEERETATLSEGSNGTNTTRKWDVYRDDGTSGTLTEARNAFSSLYNAYNLRDLYGNLPSDFSIEETEESCGQHWTAAVTFSSMDEKNESIPQQNHWYMESFDTTGGQAHITHGYDERRLAYEENDYLPKFGGGIGYNGESFDGCDIIVPSYTFSAKTRIKYEDYTLEMATRFAEKKGTINSLPFCGIPRHCCLFKGGNGTIVFKPGSELTTNEYGETVQVMEPWFEITLNFESQPAVEVSTPKGSMTKNGYDYMWTLYKIEDDSTAQTTIKKPRGIYLNQVYRESDFNEFGIYFFSDFPKDT